MVTVTIKEDSLRTLLEEAYFHGKNEKTKYEFDEWLKSIFGNRGKIK